MLSRTIFCVNEHIGNRKFSIAP